MGTGDLTATSGSIDNLTVNSKLQLGGAGSQFFAYNEDTIKVKFANWYSSNDRQYGMGQLWFETWFAAIDNGASRANRRIGFYLEEPDAGSTDSGTPGQHPSNSRFYVDINGAYLSGSLEVDGGITADGHFLPTTTEIYDLGSTAKRWRDLYLSGSTIDLGGTLITRDATGDINFKDSGTDELKVLRVKELEIGTGANKTKIRLDDDNKVSFEKSSDSSKVTTSNFFKTSVNAAAKYTITHSLGEDYPVVQIYGTDKKQVIPKDITSINTNTVEVEFDSNFTGTVVVKK